MSPGFFSSIIVPTLFLGMLSVSSLVFLLLTIRTRTPLYHALLLTSTVALISIGAQIAGLATLGFTGDVALVAQWYRLEQVVVSIYMLSIPLLLESMVELSPRHRKLNHVLLALLLMFCSAIAVSAFAVPDLFVSLSVSGEGVASFENGLAPLMPEMRRSAAGPLRQARDLLLGGLSVYAVVSLLLYVRRENARTVLPVATGLVIAIAAGIDDLWMIYFADSFLLPGFFAVQRLPIGMTVFTLCAVGAGFSRYLSAVGEVARMRDRLSDLAYNDQLTGLRNRHSFIDRMTRVCSRPASEMTENSVAILVLDLDRFKDINDSLGHETGDQLLLEVRARLATRIRTGDELYRIGGDEFAVVLSEVSDETQAGAVARKLVEALQLPFILGDRILYTGVTIGIALHPRDGLTSDTLMRHADVALARAKGERNTYRFYVKDMQKESLNQIRMVGELRNAIANNELTVVYQPQCDSHGIAFGAEALLRWNSTALGHIAPSQFIPLAEEHGIIGSIGDWVLDQVCRDYRTIMADLGSNVPISVNVSTRQLKDPQFGRRVLSTLEHYGMEPESIHLEITESVLMAQSALIQTTMNQLISAGIEFEIDDFGVGYSSLSYLRSLPVSTVKLDRSFLRNVPWDEQDSKLVRALIALIKELKLDMIAEGVEEDAQRSFLSAAGCSRMQGYLFARPLPLWKFVRFLSDGFEETSSEYDDAPQRNVGFRRD